MLRFVLLWRSGIALWRNGREIVVAACLLIDIISITRRNCETQETVHVARRLIDVRQRTFITTAIPA